MRLRVPAGSSSSWSSSWFPSLLPCFVGWLSVSSPRSVRGHGARAPAERPDAALRACSPDGKHQRCGQDGEGAAGAGPAGVWKVSGGAALGPVSQVSTHLPGGVSGGAFQRDGCREEGHWMEVGVVAKQDGAQGS